MKHFAMILAVLVFLPAVGLAQDFGPEDLEKVIKQDLNRDFTKQEVKGNYLYDIADTPYYVQYNNKGKFIILFARSESKEAHLEKLNEWNTNAIYSRAYHAGNAIVFEAPLNVSAGATRALVKAYVESSEEELKKFGAFMKSK